MTTLTIKDNTPEARKFLEFARTLSFVKDTTATEAKNTPPCQYTVEELRAHIDESMESYRRGEVIPHDEVFMRFRKWL